MLKKLFKKEKLLKKEKVLKRRLSCRGKKQKIVFNKIIINLVAWELNELISLSFNIKWLPLRE